MQAALHEEGGQKKYSQHRHIQDPIAGDGAAEHVITKGQQGQYRILRSPLSDQQGDQAVEAQRQQRQVIQPT